MRASHHFFFLLSVVQQKVPDQEQSFHLHRLETFLCSDSPVRMNFSRNDSALRQHVQIRFVIVLLPVSMAAIHDQNVTSILALKYTRINTVET